MHNASEEIDWTKAPKMRHNKITSILRDVAY